MHALRVWLCSFAFGALLPAIAWSVPVQPPVEFDPNSVQALLERIDMHVALNK